MNTAWMWWMAWGAMAGSVGVYGWLWKKAGKKGRAWLEWGLVAAVAAVSAVSVRTHEPWADELHSWLQTRDMTVAELWKEMACEGHFLTWHLILHPFARLGAQVEMLGWISWAINAVTLGWFARKAPLDGWAKAAAGLSCVFLYVNPVISRCYVLVPATLFGVAALWKRRDECPVAFGVWVALLANTHVYMAGTAAAVFAVFAWENVLKRKERQEWRKCVRQWLGLAAMSAGGAVAVAQILPSLWKSSVQLGSEHLGLGTNLDLFFMGCSSWEGMVLVSAGAIGLGVAAWQRDKGVFLVYVGSLAYFFCFSMFLYPAHIINRALLWWPVSLWAAWALGGGEGDRACVKPLSSDCMPEASPNRGRGRWFGVGLAVVSMGLGIMRPDMTWRDWQEEYDPLSGACRFIAARYGRAAEVWIDGDNFLMESAAVYLDNLKDWRTGRMAEKIHFQTGWKYEECSLELCRDEIFREYPEKESILVLFMVEDGRRFSLQGAEKAGIEVLYLQRKSIRGSGALVIKVYRGDLGERGAFWMQTGMARLAKGDRAGALAAWERAVQLDEGQWEAMNNLAWVLLKEGRVQEARAWIDRAMNNEAARESTGAWDTEAAVRRAEEERNAECTMKNGGASGGKMVK